jgi:hypothetical protein
MRRRYRQILSLTKQAPLVCLLILFTLLVWEAQGQGTDPVLIGTTRWDALAKNRTPGSVYLTVIYTMGQKKWDDPALDYWPWFTEVDSQGNLVEMNENTLAIMEQENEYAHNAGIDYWAFLRYRDLDTDSGCGWLNEQYYRYQESSNKSMMKFCWILSHSFMSWAVEKPRIINAMRDSLWVKVLGDRPLIYIYDGADGYAISDLRSAAQSAGLGNPYVVAVQQYGIGEDATSVYWPGNGWAQGGLYTDFINLVSANWASTNGSIVPWTPMNTDSRPYAERPPPWWPSPPYFWTVPPTPSEFAEMVQRGVDFVKANPGKCPANTVIIKEWNGPEESGLVMPGRHHGAAKLNGLMTVDKNGSGVIPNPNLISNPGFTGTATWTLYVNSTPGASAAFAVDGGMGQVSIVNGGSAVSDLQLYQPSLYLVPGKTYHISFKAKSAGIRTMTASIHLHSSPWTAAWSQTVGLDTLIQTFGEYSFVYQGSSSDELRINFFCGANNNTVWIDDIDLHAEIGTRTEITALPGGVLSVFPNPFTPKTVIRFSAPAAKQGSFTLVNLRGELIRNWSITPGTREIIWDACDGDGRRVPCGMYIGKLMLPGNAGSTKKIIYLR